MVRSNGRRQRSRASSARSELPILGGLLGIFTWRGTYRLHSWCVCSLSQQRTSVLAFVMSVGFAAGLGKLSFDAIVLAPHGQSRAFLRRFETRFQLFWVLEL